MSLSVNVLVLNYNGKTLLEKYLPSLQKAAARSPFTCRLGVIDNCSMDGSVEFLKKRYPDVDVYEARENRVLCSYNEVAATVGQEIVLFLNNDIGVHEDFIAPLVQPFLNDPDVFFVTPKCLSLRNGAYEGNKTRGRIRYGIFWASAVYPGYEATIEKPGPTFQGGFGAFDRKKFLELGGYDDLYLPGRLEDADICFRGQKRGWKCLYEPASIVYHEGGTSFHKEFGVRRTLVINWKNTFLFMAKNLSAWRLAALFFFWLPLRLAYSLLCLKPEMTIGFFRSLPAMGAALARRKSWGTVPDDAIFNRV